VAIQVWGKVNADMYLVDRVKKHLNLPDTMREIIRLRAMYPKCNITLIEDKANGSAIIDILRKQMTGIIAVNPLGGKVSRANAVVGAVESGNVYLPKKANWVSEYIDEFAAFPNGKHDDEVDCSTQAWNRLIYHSSKIRKAIKKSSMELYFPKYNRKSTNGDPVGKRSKINVV
jgi:predicted phage terminase large subunit-like protein